MASRASDRDILPAKRVAKLPITDELDLTMFSRIKPTNYNLSLFDLEFGGKWGYSGLVKIDTKVSEAVEEVVINTKELEIQSAEVFSGDGNCMFTP
jgi:hypothetical protein